MIRIRNLFLVHDLKHNLWRSFAVTVDFIFHHWVWRDDTHSLDIWIKLKPSINYTFVISFAWKWKYDIGIVLWEVQFKLPEFEQFDLHGISDKFSSVLNLNDWVIRSHVSQCWAYPRVFGKNVLDFGFLDILFGLNRLDQGINFLFAAWNEPIEVHKVLGKGSCLIEAGMLDSSSWDDFIGWNAKDIFVF